MHPMPQALIHRHLLEARHEDTFKVRLHGRPTLMFEYGPVCGELELVVPRL